MRDAALYFFTLGLAFMLVHALRVTVCGFATLLDRRADRAAEDFELVNLRSEEGER